MTEDIRIVSHCHAHDYWYDGSFCKYCHFCKEHEYFYDPEIGCEGCEHDYKMSAKEWGDE